MESAQKCLSWGIQERGIQGNLLYQVTLFNLHTFRKMIIF